MVGKLWKGSDTDNIFVKNPSVKEWIINACNYFQKKLTQLKIDVSPLIFISFFYFQQLKKIV
jgi:hypothetical protein